jgi:membrane protein DedA with SNARE-associated domain
VRLALAWGVLPFVPLLYPRLFLVLVALRPGPGVLLAGSILARDGDISLPAMLAIAVPLQLMWVWLYFLLGKAWQSEIDSDDRLPFVVSRLLQPNQIRRLRRVLRARGAWLVVLARFAMFPTGLLAAVAGASDMERRKFFPADGTAWLASCAVVVGAGYGLGLAEHASRIWLVGVGVAGLLVLSGALTWYLSRTPGSSSNRNRPRRARRGNR